jgi:Na+-translocating ferredoxin:NAD+ oxidoreductase RnfG subunit
MAEIDRGLFGIVGVALLMPTTAVVAAEYLSVDAAQRAVFPDADTFDPVMLALDRAQKTQMVALAGPQPPHGTLRVWRALRGGSTLGYVFVDEVLGRSDLITYATGIDTDGTLRTIEILAYRESHGAEIRNAAWRRQFANKRDLAQLQFRTDIKNISGATLSSEHVTQGVRWLLALWQVALRGAAPAAEQVN